MLKCTPIWDTLGMIPLKPTPIWDGMGRGKGENPKTLPLIDTDDTDRNKTGWDNLGWDAVSALES